MIGEILQFLTPSLSNPLEVFFSASSCWVYCCR